MKRILSMLLMIALVLSLLTGVASASRQSDAGKYLVDYVMEHGEYRAYFDTAYYYYNLPNTTDGTISGSNSLTYYLNQNKLTVGSSANWSNIMLDIQENGVIQDCYLVSYGGQELIPIDPAAVRSNTILHYTTFSGTDARREEFERYLSTAFHRALTYLSKLLKTGGYTLADLGFTSYTPYDHVCCYLADCPGKKFTDMPAGGTWSHEAIDWAILNNITTGTSATTFRPDMACSRGQIVTFLWRAAGSPKAAAAEHPFTDVNPGAYYYDAMLWAVEKGITIGSSATTFSPERVCSRAEVVTFLWRASGKPAPEYEENRFHDVEAGSFYEEAVKWAVSKNITHGIGEGTFAPKQSCSRAQVATFLYRNELLG